MSESWFASKMISTLKSSDPMAIRTNEIAFLKLF